MAIDPRNLRPAELCRLLNSTPLGAVINERQLYRHRNRAGYRLGDDNKIDLLRYVAWLVEEVHRPRATSAADEYEAQKQRSLARSAAMSKAGRDIGERTQFSIKEGDTTITVFAIYKDNHGDLWLGTHNGGAYKFNGETFEKFKL